MSVNTIMFLFVIDIQLMNKQLMFVGLLKDHSKSENMISCRLTSTKSTLRVTQCLFCIRLKVFSY